MGLLRGHGTVIHPLAPAAGLLQAQHHLGAGRGAQDVARLERDEAARPASFLITIVGHVGDEPAGLTSAGGYRPRRTIQWVEVAPLSAALRPSTSPR